MASKPASGGGRTASFVGREACIADLRRLLESERWITILGPAGVGKTRLASELLANAGDDLDTAGGAWMCDLSEASSVGGLVAAVAARLDVPLGKGDDNALAAQVEAAIASRGPTLLVLDNFEQLPEGAALIVAGWAARLADSWIVVTSRRPLRGAAEVVFHLEPLPTEAAVSLFLDRARARRRSLVADASSMAVAAEIVSRLDGLPLAIELAAAHVGALGLMQIRDDLASKQTALKGGAVDAPARHRSIDDALMRSWDLLSASERDALVGLGLFAADFDWESAAAVCGSGVETIESLLDASLVTRVDETEEMPRLRLLSVVRDFARKRSSEGGGGVAVNRYIDWAVGLCASASAREPHLGDLEAVLGRLCDGASERDVERALVTAVAIDDIVSARGPLSRRLGSLNAAISAAEARKVSNETVGRVLLARASAHLDLGHLTQSLADRERAVVLSERLGDPRLKAMAVESLARHAWHEGRVEDARRAFEEAIGLLVAAGEGHRTGRPLTFLANALLQQGKHEAARARYEEALPLLQRANDRRGVVLAMGNLAGVDAETGALELSARRCSEAIDLAAQIGDRATEAAFVTNLAILSIERGTISVARAQLERAVELHEAVGNRRWAAISRGYVGRTLELAGDVVEARVHYERALSAHEELGNALFVGLVSAWLARLFGRAGAFTDARALLVRAQALEGESAWRDLVPIIRWEVEALASAAGSAAEVDALRSAAARISELRAEKPTSMAAEVRMALSELRDVRPSAPPPPPPVPSESPAACTIATSGRWFRMSGEAEVSLQTRKALHRVLAELARGRQERPGEAMSWESLLEAGWPNERVHPTAGAARVYTTVATLRRMGLKWILLRRDDGYLLDPATPLVFSSS